ncbi:MAG: Lrp/AsnC family transcriptional regulator [Clostridia bacterium]|nr:Lrp/AsnC family transcriptional regulator [Clostridia bacterium]
MDIIDKQILELLSHNAYATSTEIGCTVGLSVPAVNKRIQKLQSDRVIRKFTILTDEKRAGKPVVAFIFIVIQYGDGVKTLMDYIDHDPDVLECYAVTGEYDYLIKICATDVETLENKLLHLKKQKGVMKSHTMLSLMEHKFQPTVLPDTKESK